MGKWCRLDDLEINLDVLHADFDCDDAIFENILEEEQRDASHRLRNLLSHCSI